MNYRYCLLSIERMSEKMFDLFLQQRHLVILGNRCKCAKQLP